MEADKISLGEHMLRTQDQMKKIMDLAVVVAPKLFEQVRIYKQNKKRRLLDIKKEVDWDNVHTEQGLGESNLSLSS